MAKNKEYKLGKQIVTELRVSGEGEVLFLDTKGLIYKFSMHTEREDKFTDFGLNGMLFEDLTIKANVKEILVKGPSLIFQTVVYA